MIYLAICHALLPAPSSASSFPCHGRTHDFESLEPAACNVEKGGSAYFPWFFFTTRFPQISFEDKVVWFSFLNSIFINIWPSGCWCTFLYIASLLTSSQDFLGNFFFLYAGLVKWHILGSLVSRGLQRCSAWISASQAFKIEELHCFRLCSYFFTVRLFNNLKFTVTFFFLFFQKWLLVGLFWDFWGGCFEFWFEYCLLGEKGWRGCLPPPPAPRT